MKRFIHKHLLLFILTLTAMATKAADFQVDKLYYTILSQTEYTVEVAAGPSRYQGIKAVIPATVEYNGATYTVVAVGRDAFYGAEQLQNVEFPNTIKSIGYQAFVSCRGLKTITLPESLESIGYNAFNNCSELYTITLPNSLKSLGEGAFAHCSKLETVGLPNSLESIDHSAFAECTKLTSITIPENVSLGAAVFNGCTNLTKVTLSDGVTLGTDVFIRCTALTDVTLPKTLTNLNDGTFNGCTSLTTVDLPESVTRIGGRAFSGCSNLESITLPSSLTEVGVATFQNCVKLKQIDIPASLKVLSNDMFNGCTSLESIDLKNTLESIGSYTFRNCGLKTFEMDDNIISVGGYAFEGCTKLESVKLSNSLKEIPASLFTGCTALKSITIPDFVKTIGDYAFDGCTSLSSINWGKSLTTIRSYAFRKTAFTSIVIPNTVNSIGGYIFRDCKKLKTAVLSKNITTIPGSCFAGCSSLTTVPIHNSITYINGSAFCDCVSLTSIDIPNSVKILYSDAFARCAKLESITLGNSLNMLGDSYLYPVFSDCQILKNITCRAENPPSISTAQFTQTVLDEAVLYVPKDCKPLYEAANFWKDFAHIEEVEFAETKNYLTIQNHRGYVGYDTELPIEMTNDRNITAIQADIYLPEGVEIATDEYGDYMITLSERATSSHSVSSSIQDDGAMRIMIFSSSNKPFSGTGGEVFTLPLRITENTKEGENAVILSKVTLVEPSSHEIASSPLVSNIDIFRTATGDSNGDGRITLGDAVNNVNYIMGLNPENFIFAAADINGDGNVTIADVVEIINIILSGNNTPLAAAKAPMMTRYEKSGSSLSISEFSIKPGETKTLTVNMDNNIEVTAFQFDIKLPKGLNVVRDEYGDAMISLTSRATNTHSLASSEQADGDLRVLAFSSKNRLFKGNSGALVEIEVKADDNLAAGEYPVTITSIGLSEADATEHAIDDYAGTITVEKSTLYGDSNSDGAVSIADAVNIANHILGLATQDFNIINADANRDGDITISDAVATLKIILDNMWTPADNVSRQMAKARKRGGDRLIVDDFAISSDNSTTIGVKLNGSSDYTAMQADICLPEGLTVENISAGARASSHMLLNSDLNSNIVRVAIFSIDNRNFAESDEALLEITVKSDGEFNGGDLLIKNILVADGSATEYGLDDTGANGTTGITSKSDGTIKIAAVDGGIRITNAIGKEIGIFTLDGRSVDTFIAQSDDEVSVLQPGIYIVKVGTTSNKVIIK